MEEFTSVSEILEKTGKYTGLTKGVSMRPMIHQGRDNIIIVKNNERLKKYDVALYQAKSGKYVMHRVIEVYDDHYIFMGDNLKAREYVTDDMVRGRLAGYFKKGKRYIDCDSNKIYRLYSKLAVALIPIRPFTIFVNRCFAFIENHIIKRNKK